MKVYKCGECGSEDFVVQSRKRKDGPDDVFTCCINCGWEIAKVEHPEEVVDLAGAVGQVDPQ